MSQIGNEHDIVSSGGKDAGEWHACFCLWSGRPMGSDGIAGSDTGQDHPVILQGGSMAHVSHIAYLRRERKASMHCNCQGENTAFTASMR